MPTKKLWVKCTDAIGTQSLKEGTRYLVEVRGQKVKVLISEHNRQHVHGSLVSRNRFETIKPKASKS